MAFIRSERVAAALLLIAAALGLAAANSSLVAGIGQIRDTVIALPGLPVELSIEHWISDGLLAVFFFVVAVELKAELTVGQLSSPAHALRPTAAALGGIIVPALIYLTLTAGTPYQRGWPVPTATDIAFALGILAVFGKGIPSRLRIFMLALAILDDVIAIVVIAVLFTHGLDVVPLLASVVTVTLFALLSRGLRPGHRWWIGFILVVVAGATWVFVLLSGVHPTIAGVALGIVMARNPAHRVRHALEPVTNGVILPLFAFSAAFVPVPAVGVQQLSQPFWAILVALPVGKLVGITVGASIVAWAVRSQRPALRFPDLLAAGALGGIGFTVSLLMNELAFARFPEIADEGTIAVLLGSSISIVAAAILVSSRARYSRRLRALRVEAERRRALGTE